MTHDAYDAISDHTSRIKKVGAN